MKNTKKGILLGLLLTAGISISSMAQVIELKVPKVKKKGDKQEDSRPPSEAPSQKAGKANEPEASKKKYSEEQLTKLLDTSNYPDLNTDHDTLKKLWPVYAPNGSRGGVKPPDQPLFAKDALEQLNDLDGRMKMLNEIQSKYQEYWSAYQQKENKKSDMEGSWQALKESMSIYREKAMKYPNLAAGAESSLKDGLDLVEKFRNKKGPGIYPNTKLNENNYDAQVYPYFRSAEACVAMLRLQKGNDDAEAKALDEKVKAAYTKAEEVKSGVNEELYATEPMPEDLYKGADKAELKSKLKAHWNKWWPKDEVLAVYISESEWKKQEGYKWNQATNSNERYSYSKIYAEVVVKKDGKIAIVNTTYIIKNHLSNNQLEFRTVKEPGNAREVLRSRLKLN